MKITKNYMEEIGIIGAAAIATGAVALYKRMLSDAARTCNQFYGVEKTICMLNYKIRIAQTMMGKSKNADEKLMWSSRIKKYQYQLTVAKRKQAVQRRLKKK